MILEAFVLAALLQTVSQDQGEPVWIGLVSGDSHLSPFGRLDGDRWTNPWPPDDHAEDREPASLPETPPSWWGPTSAPKTWALWNATGTTRAIHIGKAIRHPDDLETFWDVETDAPNDGDPTKEWTWTTRIATSRPVPFSFPLKVEVGAPEWIRVRKAILPTFKILERNSLAALAKKSSEGEDDRWIETIRGCPLEDDSDLDLTLFRTASPLEGKTLFYIEARRRLPSREIPAGDSPPVWINQGSTMTAWLVDEGCGDLRFLRKEQRFVRVMDLDRVDKPLGFFAVGSSISVLVTWSDDHSGGLSIVLLQGSTVRRFNLYDYPGC